MSTSKDKALWASSGFQSRTNEDRRAYRAKLKAERKAFYKLPEQVEAQKRINEAHECWLASQATGESS